MFLSGASIFRRLSNVRRIHPLLARAINASTMQASFPAPSRNMTSAVGLPVVYHPAYSAPVLPPGHQFPMKIFRLIYTRLLQKGTIQPSQVQIPEAFPTLPDLCLVHDPAYVDAFLKGRLDPEAIRRIGLPMSPLLITRTMAEVAGTLLTAELALQHGLACNTAGGTHHAFRGLGSGYCIINDIAVSSAVLLERKVVDRILVVDLDVHQGDGTASILRSEPRVFTMSMHCSQNFPARKQKSDLDVELPAGTGDDAYLHLLAHHLLNVLNSFRPNLVLFDAGVDTHINDSLGKLCLTDTGLYRREMQELAARHCVLHEAASEVWLGHGL